MHLKELNLVNFRSFSDETVLFEPELTVLVGENNGGKSNIIDAIRLVSTPLTGRRELHCELTDIRFGSDAMMFEVGATFDDLSPPQQGRLLSATTDDTLRMARFGITYDASATHQRVRPALWGGRFKGVPEPGAHEMIRHVYLPPLRDAKRALASGNPTRIHALLHHFLGGRDADEVAKSLTRGSDDPILKTVDEAVGAGLDELTAGVRRQATALGFNANEKLIDIARDLRFKLADHGVAPEDLRYSGHGLANLLYIATIAVELEKSDDAELTVFLVEEPEAHLHPQLQAAVLGFLQERAEQALKAEKEEHAPAGHLQVVVATHSPNLSAWVASKRLVFVRSVPAKRTRDEHGLEPDVGKDAASHGVPSRAESRTIPLAKLDLSEADRRKIDRYLDVTKSALLFGGRVLLVEGVAEALLLPVIARHHVLRERPADLRRFLSAVFVPIDGVDFRPYTRALAAPYCGVTIADRLVIVTDGDKQVAPDADDLPGNKRKRDLEAVASGSLAPQVFVSTYTLEVELIAAGNTDMMRDVYMNLHPQSEVRWEEAIRRSGDEQARAVSDLFRATRKGDYAHILADQIAENESFCVPDYIRCAIESVVR